MQNSDKSSPPEIPSVLPTSALKTVIGEDLFATRLDTPTYSAPLVGHQGHNETLVGDHTLTTGNDHSLPLMSNSSVYDQHFDNSIASTGIGSDLTAQQSQLFDHQILAAAPEFGARLPDQTIVAAGDAKSQPITNHRNAAWTAGASETERPVTDTPAAATNFARPPLDAANNDATNVSWVEEIPTTVSAPEQLATAPEEPAAILPETVITGTPIAVVPRASISMPKLYVQVRHNEPIRGYAASEDLPLEVSVGQEASSWSFLHEFRSLMRDFFFAGLSAVLLVIFAVQPVKVEGTSMLPKLFDGERIFINKFIYQVDEIKRGDVVVFWYPKNPNQSFIKRVIGVPGDEVRFTNGRLFINNKLVPEPYLSTNYTKNPVPNRYWVVEDHHYFVMGDNRDASNDSRAWGLVPEKYIYGKAFFRYWPLDRFGSLQK